MDIVIRDIDVLLRMAENCFFAVIAHIEGQYNYSATLIFVCILFLTGHCTVVAVMHSRPQIMHTATTLPFEMTLCVVDTLALIVETFLASVDATRQKEMIIFQLSTHAMQSHNFWLFFVTSFFFFFEILFPSFFQHFQR